MKLPAYRNNSFRYFVKWNVYKFGYTAVLLWWQTVINWTKSCWFKKCKSRWCVKICFISLFWVKKTWFSLQLMWLFFLAYNKQHVNTLDGSFNHHLDHFKKGNITWSHDLIHNGESSHRPNDPFKKSSSDEASDHKSRRETMRGDVPRFALPRMAFERERKKKSSSLISWYGYNRKPRGMNMNLTSTRGKSLHQLTSRI